MFTTDAHVIQLKPRINRGVDWLVIWIFYVSMVLSAVQIAKRAFVKILLAFATQCQVSVNVSRDSADKDILAAYRRVVKKVHPDKGGKKEDQQKLQDAKRMGDAML